VIVPFGATLARELVPAVDGQIGFLFPARNGRRMSPRQAQRRFGMWIEKAGIASATLHGLRHSFGQALFDRTGNLGLCQTALRHRSISSTTIYARASTAQVRHALCE
jgi:integrase